MLTSQPRAITVLAPRDSPLHRDSELLGPGLAVRIAARLRRASLGRALSRGVDPTSSALIAARATQLNRPSTRARIARALERVALSADRPRSHSRVLPSRAAVRINRPELFELASLLRSNARLYARGIAALELMLTDGAGPAYTDRHGEAMAQQLALARAGLTGSATP